MDKDLKDRDVLLVKEKDSSELKVVTGVNKDGTPKTALPADENNPDFLKIDKHGNVLENFFENFMRQAKDPTRFEFFKVPLDKLKEGIARLQDAFKNPDKPENKETLDTHRVEPSSFQKQTQAPAAQAQASYNAIDESRIDWGKLEQQWGVKRETLEKTGNLEKLLNWQKTDLLPVTAKFDETTLRTDARLSLREMPDGKLSFAIHAIRKEPELDKYYFGVKFTEEDRKNLLTTGNLGRVADVQYRQGETTPVFISLDKLTNELAALRADRVKIPETVKGVQLDEKQKQALADGKPIYVEGMISKNGKEFSAYLQVNADRRGIEFRFDNSQKQSHEQKDVPDTFRKKELTEDQRSSLRESKTVYVDGLEDKKGKKYSGYITLNKESGKFDFMFSKDYKEALAAGKVIPDDRHKTQVAVNSEGKTNEATKKIDKPLDKGQTQPTEKQAAREQKKEVKKAKGVKM
jgi:hypothetical protein